MTIWPNGYHSFSKQFAQAFSNPSMRFNASTYRRVPTSRYPRRSYKRSRVATTKYVQKKVASYHEVKTIDVEPASSYTVPATPAFPATGTLLLSPIVQGTGTNNRLGRDVMYKKLHVTGYAQPGSLGESDLYRLTVVYDKESKGTAPALGDIFDNSISVYPIANWNSDTIPNKRFVVLKDFVMDANTINGVATSDANIYHFQFSVNLRNRKGRFISGSNNGNITDSETGAIWLITSSIAGHAATNFACKLEFVDM